MGLINIETNGKICTIALNREQRLNALNTELINELANAIQNLKDERIVIFKGKGKAFAAGADVKEMSEMDNSKLKEFSKKGQQLLNRIEDLDKLTIAVINGFCFGGGLELACACDLRISSKISKFGLPELKLGVIPGFGAFFRVQKLIGNSGLKNILFTGKIINAEEAKAIGLVNEIAEDAEKEAEKIINNFLENISFTAFVKAKTVLNKNRLKNRNELLELENKTFSDVCTHNDKKEGIRAFLEKREPKFE
ncbi:enoyl-CoA hydratase/isomerase family protein [Candidatus Woesearchaeota archaeon]|nr:enoyl-CoA hydratase/isomerase family protein [Candidatus Woesearchaeota archaeon]